MKYFIIFFIIVTRIFAQTEEWKLTWDKNPDADSVQYYSLYKNTTNIPPDTPYFAVIQDTFITDNDIEKNTLYYYWVTATNATDESNFSEQASEAIPLITLQDTIKLQSAAHITLNLSDYVDDPEESSDIMRWVLKSIEHKTPDTITVDTTNIKTEHEIIFYAPELVNTLADIIFTVADTSGFFDKDTITVLSDSSVPPPIEEDTGIIVYPVPYDESEHAIIGGIYFTGLKNGYILKIYNLLGEPVFKQKMDKAADFLWNLTNSSNSMVNPGLYLYRIQDKNKNIKKSGKLVVIR